MRILLSSPSVGFLTTVTTKTNWMKKDLQLMEKFRPSISLQQIIKIMELYIVKDKMSLDIKKSLVLFKLCQQVSKLSFLLIEELSKCIGIFDVKKLFNYEVLLVNITFSLRYQILDLVANKFTQ